MITLHIGALLVAVVGLIVYALPFAGKVTEVGRLAFAVGLLAFLFGHR